MSYIRQCELTDANQMNLGEFKAALEKVADKAKRVRYRFGYLSPTSFRSWRGDYAEIALGYEEDVPYPTVTEMLDRVTAAIGSEMEGYKGGIYLAEARTPVWIANWGNSGCSCLIGVAEGEYDVFLEVGYTEY